MVSLPIWALGLIVLASIAVGCGIMWFVLKPIVDESEVVDAPRDSEY